MTTIRIPRTSQRQRHNAAVYLSVNPRLLPMTRGECPTQRPCPFASCRFNLVLDAYKGGSIKLTYGSDDLDDFPANNCSLDIADGAAPHGLTLVEIAEHLRITRERARQILEMALHKLHVQARTTTAVRALREFLEE